MRRWWLIALLLLCGCGGVPATATLPAAPPTATLHTVQQTAQAYRQQVRRRTATPNSQRAAACQQVRTIYQEKGLTFDEQRAHQDIELAVIELRIIRTGAPERPRTTLAQQADTISTNTLLTCLGLPMR